MRRSILQLLAMVAVLVTAAASASAVVAGGGCHDTSTLATESTGNTVVRMDGCAFAPAINRVAVGASVTFLNTSTGVHDVTGRAMAWRTPTLEPGESFSVRFTERGIHPYSCSLHPGMAGVIVAGEVGTAEGARSAGGADSPAAPVGSSGSPDSQGPVRMELVAAAAAGGAVAVLAMLALVRRRTAVIG